MVGPVEAAGRPDRRVDREPVRAGDRRPLDVEIAAAGAVEVGVGDGVSGVAGPVRPVDEPAGGVDRGPVWTLERRGTRVDGSAAPVAVQVRVRDRGRGAEVGPVDPVGGPGAGRSEERCERDEAETKQGQADAPRKGTVIRLQLEVGYASSPLHPPWFSRPSATPPIHRGILAPGARSRGRRVDCRCRSAIPSSITQSGRHRPPAIPSSITQSGRHCPPDPRSQCPDRRVRGHGAFSERPGTRGCPSKAGRRRDEA